MSDDENGGNKNKNNSSRSDKLDGGGLSSLNRYFDALADPRRRHTLYYLNDHRTEPITIDELARHVTAMETEYAPDTLVEADYADIKRELYHNHLPRLDDYGIIDYDPRSGDMRFHQSSRGLLLLLWVSQLIERPP